MGVYVVYPHVSQFDGSALAGENCTPASGANGAKAATGGAVAKTAAQIRALVARREETNPDTPGWSLPDLELAMGRLGVPFDNRTGHGWAALQAARAAGLYVVLQGDSDRFGDASCSGAFDGDHCIGVHPNTDGTRWWIDDPICPTGRWEEEATLRAYATKLYPTIRFGVFVKPVPKIAPITYTWAQVRRGEYTTYTINRGQAHREGTLKTGGFGAEAKTRTVVQVDGTGTITLLRILTGAHAGKILNSRAPGITLSTRTR